MSIHHCDNCECSEYEDELKDNTRRAELAENEATRLANHVIAQDKLIAELKAERDEALANEQSSATAYAKLRLMTELREADNDALKRAEDKQRALSERESSLIEALHFVEATLRRMGFPAETYRPGPIGEILQVAHSALARQVCPACATHCGWTHSDDQGLDCPRFREAAVQVCDHQSPGCIRKGPEGTKCLACGMKMSEPASCDFCHGTGQHLCPDVAEPITIPCSKKGCTFRAQQTKPGVEPK